VIPLTVIAHLGSPAILPGPLALDAPLYAGVGRRAGALEPSGWADFAAAFDEPLPLARVETPAGWWWAVSAAVPVGPEALAHAHRRPCLEAAARWTSARSVNVAAGPDKALRLPLYYRPGQLALTWTCVGEAAGLLDLLCRVGGVGGRTSHGWGWVDRWTIAEGGPPLADYATDLRLRHLPAATRPQLPEGHAVSRLLPLRSPYYDRSAAVPCWQYLGGAP
jgi:hypothetical protein